MKTKLVPQWDLIFKNEAQRISGLLGNTQALELIKKANSEYLHWEKFKYQKMPMGASPELMWALIKLTRQGNQEYIPINSENGIAMSFFSSKEQQKSLSYIDSYTSGAIISLEGVPNEIQKNKLVIDGLIEEAISSSQIEGANTTRKVAKSMIELKREPRNKDERMILNNYHAMIKIEEWKNRPLNDEFLLEIHSVLTQETMENKEDEGRFREDADEVVVVDRTTGEIVHTPPVNQHMKNQLKQLYKFVNEEDGSYIHPFIKGSIIHFSLGYIHPFVDGNGRIARALFYWYLIKKNYWMFKFLPISLQIKKKDWRPGYDRAYQYVESDPLDVTYFLNYKLKLACNAIADFIKYLEKKQKDANRLKQRLVASSEINQRQLDLIDLMQNNPVLEVDANFYKERNRIVYETARSDLNDLVAKKILISYKNARKYVYARGENFPSK